MESAIPWRCLKTAVARKNLSVIHPLLYPISNPFQLHFVHLREGLSLPEALQQPDGSAAVGIFYYLSGKRGRSMAALEKGVRRVVERSLSNLLGYTKEQNHLP
jgi:hypothetical protein